MPDLPERRPCADRDLFLADANAVERLERRKVEESRAFPGACIQIHEEIGTAGHRRRPRLRVRHRLERIVEALRPHDLHRRERRSHFLPFPRDTSITASTIFW